MKERPIIKKIIAFLSKYTQDDETVKENNVVEEKEVKLKERFVLSIDGGGMKGLIPTLVLKELSSILNKDGNNKPIKDYFDLIVGTSSGGLITLCLSKNNPNTPDEILNLYIEKCGVFFPPPKNFFERVLNEKFPIDNLEAFLKSHFKDETFSSLSTQVLLTSYDIKNSCIYNLSNKSVPHLELWKAARCTTAAPTYYKPFHFFSEDGEHSLIDGGVVANNPVLWAYTKTRELFPNTDIIHILSLGNFKKEPIFNPDSHSFSWFDITKGNLPIHSLYHHAQVNNADKIASILPDLDYVRIEHNGCKDDIIKMDDTSTATINKLMIIGKNLAENNHEKLENFANNILNYNKENQQ